MTATYAAISLNTAFGNGKSMLSIFNGSGSGVVIRVYRIWTINSTITAISGVTCDISIRRITASSSGTTVVPFKHDSNSSDVPAQVLFRTNATVTATDILRIHNTDNDEVSSAGTGTNELSILFPLKMIWESGYYDSNVEPLVLREGYGITVNSDTNTTIGTLDVYMEFTVSAS